MLQFFPLFCKLHNSFLKAQYIAGTALGDSVPRIP